MYLFTGFGSFLLCIIALIGATVEWKKKTKSIEIITSDIPKDIDQCYKETTLHLL